MKKLEPNDSIVFPHRYRGDGTHRRDRTGGAKKRVGTFIIKRDRARCHPWHDHDTYRSILPTAGVQRIVHDACHIGGKTNTGNILPTAVVQRIVHDACHDGGKTNTDYVVRSIKMAINMLSF